MDPELEFTIEQCINNADHPDDIFIGVAITCEEEFYRPAYYDFAMDIKNKFKDNKRITINLYSEHEFGLGWGRNNASSMYSGQDYFLQIDSHTMFDKGWDTQCIDLLYKAIQQTNNYKTVLTGVPCTYSHLKNEGRRKLSEYFQYSTIIERSKDDVESTIPKAGSMELIRDAKLENMEDKIIPAIKVSAAFIFGNKELANNIQIPKEILFWEEEPIQSIELFSKGFDLAFPNYKMKISHLFWQNFTHPDTATPRRWRYNSDVRINKMSNFYDQYKENNLDKVEQWELYADIKNIKTDSDLPYIPKKYFSDFIKDI